MLPLAGRKSMILARKQLKCIKIRVFRRFLARNKEKSPKMRKKGQKGAKRGKKGQKGAKYVLPALGVVGFLLSRENIYSESTHTPPKIGGGHHPKNFLFSYFEARSDRASASA